MSFTMYTTTWCPYCVRLKTTLTEAGITDYAEIDIEEHPEAVAVLEKANNGRKTVPTLIFEDGTAIINPPLPVILEKIGR